MMKAGKSCLTSRELIRQNALSENLRAAAGECDIMHRQALGAWPICNEQEHAPRSAKAVFRFSLSRTFLRMRQVC